jgi:hypothetical protein
MRRTLFLVLVVAGCAETTPLAGQVRQGDLDAWRGAARWELETHPIFSRIPRVVKVLADGREIWNYANCNAYGLCCYNQFLVNGPVVEGYRPVGRCYTDCSARPASTAGVCQAYESEQEASAERGRRSRRAVAAGLSALGAGLTGAQASVDDANEPSASTVQLVPTPTPMPSLQSAPSLTSSGCSSDYDCGMGNRCVKPNFSSRGTCMRLVNEYGGPAYDLPRIDSVSPKMPSRHDCHLLTDCPIGFRCDTNSGACIR